MKAFVKSLDLLSWDNALPLTLILGMSVWAAVIAAGILSFSVPLDDLDSIKTVFVDVGVQTSAGIYAIIVTLSLVAIQTASQEYSHRIMESYIRSVMFWSTTAVYLFVMVANVLLQVSPDVAHNQRLIGMSVVGSVLALLLLVPHFLVTAAYLRPEFIIAKLLRRVDRDYLTGTARLSAAGRRWIGTHADRLLPVVEILERSIDRGDITTTRRGLEQFHLTYTRHADPGRVREVDGYFIDYLQRVGRKAVAEADEEAAAGQVIEILGTVGANGPAEAAVDSIGAIGTVAVKKDFEPVVHLMIDALHTVSATTQSEEARGAVIGLYEDMADALVVGERRRLLEQLVGRVTETASSALEAKAAARLERCLRLLEVIGHDSATHNLVDVTLRAARSLQTLGVRIAATDPDAAERIVRMLLRMERPVDAREREALAQMDFTKREVERAIEKARPPAPPKAEVKPPTPEAAPVGNADGRAGKPEAGSSAFAGLWDPPEPEGASSAPTQGAGQPVGAASTSAPPGERKRPPVELEEDPLSPSSLWGEAKE